jgi:hypothetical protein
MSRHFQQFQGEGHLLITASAVLSFPAPGQHAQIHTHTYKSLTQFLRNGAARDTNFSDAEMVSAFTLSGPTACSFSTEFQHFFVVHYHITTFLVVKKLQGGRARDDDT